MPENPITIEQLEPLVMDILNRYRSRTNIYNIIAERLDFQAQTNAQLTANQNNYEIGNGTHFRISSDAARTITGFTGGVSGKLLVLSNSGSNIITLANQNASSLAANRIITGLAANYNTNADESVFLIYDDTTARWRLIGSTFTHSLLIGGTGTASTLTLRSTSGVGTTGADIIFQVGNNGATEAMRILNSGFIGIGTASPGALLEIEGNVANGLLLLLDGITQHARFDIDVDNTTSYIPSTNLSVAGVLGGRILLERGTSPVVGGNQDDLVIVNTKANKDIKFNTHNGTSQGIRMTIFEDGSVGIGTTSPDRLLHPEVSDALTNTVAYGARISHITSGTPATNIGIGLEFEQETTADNNEIGATIEAVVTDVTATDEDFKLQFQIMAAGALAVRHTMTPFDLYTVVWTDYSDTTTLVGWSSTTTKQLHYKKVGRLVFVLFRIIGTSNATTATATLPYTAFNDPNNFYNFIHAMTVQDNSVTLTTPGRARIGEGTATLTFDLDFAGGGWTASGTKEVVGQILYETNE